MVALGAGGAELGALNATELLDVAMIGFNRPSVFRIAQACEFTHVEGVGGPVFTAAV